MKINKISAAASSLLLAFSVTNALADTQTITLKKGWNLVGSALDGVNAKYSDFGVVSVWAYDSNAKTWKASVDASLPTSVSSLEKVNSGEGFWVNSDSEKSITLNGTPSTNATISINEGWQLLSPKGDAILNMDQFNKPNITTVWTFEDNQWMAYSPQDNLNNLIGKNENIKTLEFIKKGEGFWVNASGAAADLNTPPNIGQALVMTDKLNAIPLAEGDVYINDIKMAQTKQNGTFDLTGIPNGASVTIKKDGLTTAYGSVKDGKVVLIAQYDNSPKLDVKTVQGNAKPISKAIVSSDGKMALMIDKANTNKDLTISVVPFISPSAAPKLNALEDGTTPEQLSLIGGGFINIENSNGEKLQTSDLDETDTFEVSLEQTSFLGDLEDILNGNTDNLTPNYEAFSKSAFDQLTTLKGNGTLSLFVLQYVDGKWEKVGNTTLKNYKKIKKTSNGTKEISKYKLTTDEVTLTKLAPTAFALKMENITGSVTISTKEGGYKMFDGTIVTEESNSSDIFEWINKPVSLATVIGDDSITSGADMTGDEGNVTVDYKVPFLSPNFSVSIKKDGYYDTMVNCEVEASQTTCSDATMYKIPDTASIKGFVTNKITTEGVEDALVTLVNPEVLSAENIKTSVDEDGNSIVQVGYFPTVTYTWTASKIDDDGIEKFVELKSGSNDSSFASLSETEIMNKLVLPYDSATKVSAVNEANENVEIANPSGSWNLKVSAVQSFTNSSSLTEGAIGSFNIDILMPKLAGVLTGTLSEKQEAVTLNENGDMVSLSTNIMNTAIYGGNSIGFLYRTGTQLDNFKWTTQLLAAADTNCDLDDPQYIASDLVEICMQKVVDTPLEYTKSLYPFGQSVKYMTSNFTDLLKPDTQNNDKPFFKSGFTIRVMAEGSLDFTGINDNGVTTQYTASYTDLPEDGISSLVDFLDVPSISLVGESATAYMRQTTTENDGSYYINMIPVELNDKLKVYAKASGYKFDNNTDVKLVNDLSEGVISEYNLELEPIDSEGLATPPEPIALPQVESFKDWDFITSSCTQDSVWQVLENAETITNSSLSKNLLADNDTTTSGYLWFGNKTTGSIGTSTVCGKAQSTEYNLGDFAFPVLEFKSWFEIESVDAAKGMYDQMEIGFIYKGTSETTVPMLNGNETTLIPGEYYSLKKLNPDNEPSIQSSTVGFSSAGIGLEPVWLDVKVPVDFLAGLPVQFVFDFNSKDSLYNNFRSWGIDGVKVVENMETTLNMPPMIPTLEPVETQDNTLAKKVRN